MEHRVALKRLARHDSAESKNPPYGGFFGQVLGFFLKMVRYENGRNNKP